MEKRVGFVILKDGGMYSSRDTLVIDLDLLNGGSREQLLELHRASVAIGLIDASQKALELILTDVYPNTHM